MDDTERELRALLALLNEYEANAKNLPPQWKTWGVVEKLEHLRWLNWQAAESRPWTAEEILMREG